MPFSTAQKAEIAMAKVRLRAAEKGIAISVPTSDSVRYDLVIDYGDRLCRAQVKYCDRQPTGTGGAVSLELTSYHRSGKLSFAGYSVTEIDVILVYIPRIDKVLCLGPEVFAGRHEIQIRLEPTKNGQTKGCLFATDYLW